MRYLVTALLAVVLTACAVTTSQPAAAPNCDRDQLPTLYPGVFTFGTDQPAYPPWYIGDDPANGEGFESAVAFAVADKLGFPPADVRWVRIPFNAAMAPGAKPFDADLSQYSITDQRREVVDFSTPYYNVLQAVVTLSSSPVATVSSAKDLRPYKLGAQVGTTSSTAARLVGAERPVAVYNSNVDAKVALRTGQIDALVLDLPTALAVKSEIPDAVIVGQLPRHPTSAEQFGILLDKDSGLTACVSQAVDALRAEGKLADLQQRWLVEGANPPVLN